MYSYVLMYRNVYMQRAFLPTHTQALGSLMGHIALREPHRDMSDCLWRAAEILAGSSSSKQRDDFINATITLSKTVDLFLSTAIDDMQTSKNRFWQARSSLQDAERALSRSRSSALTEPSHREKLQVRQLPLIFFPCLLATAHCSTRILRSRYATY